MFVPGNNEASTLGDSRCAHGTFYHESCVLWIPAFITIEDRDCTCL